MMNHRNKPLRPRYQKAVDLRRAGLTYKEIGRRVGRHNDPSHPVTVERIRQMLAMATRRLLHPSRADHPDREWAVERWDAYIKHLESMGKEWN